jgi:uncharacterized protein YndB with AHSA1/START domain
MRTFHIVKAVAAPPALVWNVLADYPGMTKWAGARRVDIERPGVDVPNGVGTIRALKSWHGTIREEITGFEPERRMSYKGLSGVPAREYGGGVELSRRGDATQMSWTVSFQPRKFTAAIVSAVIKRMVSKGVDRLVQVVEGTANNRQPG